MAATNASATARMSAPPNPCRQATPDCVLDDFVRQVSAPLTQFVMNEDDRSKNREILTSAVQSALLSAAKQAVGPLRQLRVVIDGKTGGIQVFAKLLVVDKVVDKHQEISLLDTKRAKQQVELGDEVEMDVTPVGFGPVAASAAKQALMDQIRRAEEGL